MWFEQLRQDVGYGFRTLGRNPGFSAVTILTLGLGIGANALIFSLLNTALLRPMPTANSERLITLTRDQKATFSYPDYRDFNEQSKLLDGMAASNPTESSIEMGGEVWGVGAEAVSGNYARVLGARAAIGRWFDNENEAVAVISDRAWRRYFQADPQVLGRRFRSEKTVYTVIGVTGPEFAGTFPPVSIDLWIPLRVWSAQNANIRKEMEDRLRTRFFVFGLLRPGTSIAAAQAELNGISTGIQATAVRGFPNAGGRRQTAPVMALLMFVSSVVLLICCVNVGNMILARSIRRTHEISVRLALGAGQGRILRQMLTESALLAIGGGVAGFLIGTMLIQARVLDFASGMETIRVELAMDWRVTSFIAAIAVLTVFLVGLTPAWRASRSNAGMALRSAWMPTGGLRLRRIATIGQVGASLALLLLSGLFVQSLRNARTTHPGFQVEKRVIVSLMAPAEFDGTASRRFLMTLADRLKDRPQVQSTALMQPAPLMPLGAACVGRDGENETIGATSGIVDQGYFQAMQVPVEEGRSFSETAGSVVVNRTLAKRLWQGQPAVGRKLALGCREKRIVQVAGVAADTKVRSMVEAPLPHVYLSLAAEYGGGLAHLIVEMRDDLPLESVRGVRSAILESGVGVRLFGVRTLGEHVEESHRSLKLVAGLVGGFGLLALALAAIGLAGVIAYDADARTKEMGLRIALGAGRSSIFGLVIARSLGTAAMGIAFGLLVAAGLAQLARGFLFGVTPSDAASYAAAALVWLTVAVLAGLWPAVRASRVEAMITLRHD